MTTQLQQLSMGYQPISPDCGNINILTILLKLAMALVISFVAVIVSLIS